MNRATLVRLGFVLVVSGFMVPALMGCGTSKAQTDTDQSRGAKASSKVSDDPCAEGKCGSNGCPPKKWRSGTAQPRAIRKS